jgi:hypothetical protein
MGFLCRLWSTVGAIALIASQESLRPFPSAPADLMTRLTTTDDGLVYGRRQGSVWQIVSRPSAAAVTADPAILVEAQAGVVLLSPALGADGRLYFESTQRVPAVAGREDTDVWVMERVAQGWSTPRPLGAPFDSAFNEHYPTVDRTGTLCFNSARPGGLGGNDIYCAPLRGSTPPQHIAIVSSAAQDAAPWLTASGDRLYFASNRPGGSGGWDLYVSRREHGEWSAPTNLGPPINSPEDESWGTLTASGDALVFQRNKTGTSERAVYVSAIN